jgi:hypothetical protein
VLSALMPIQEQNSQQTPPFFSKNETTVGLYAQVHVEKDDIGSSVLLLFYSISVSIHFYHFPSLSTMAHSV